MNLVPQVGQSLIRAHVVGTENRKATTGELRAMKVILEQFLKKVPGECPLEGAINQVAQPLLRKS